MDATSLHFYWYVLASILVPAANQHVTRCGMCFSIVFLDTSISYLNEA